MIEITSNQLYANVNGQLQPLGVVGVGGGSPQSGFIHDVQFGNGGLELESGHIVSNFSTNNVVIVPSDYAIDYTLPYEIGIYFKASSVPTRSCALCGTVGSNQFYRYPSIEFQPHKGKMWFGISSNGSSWASNLYIENLSFEADQWYFVKVGNDYEETGKPYIMFTDDFVTWAETVGGSTSPVQYTDSSYHLGFGGNALKNDIYALNCIIDFDKTYIKNGGEVIWGRENSSL